MDKIKPLMTLFNETEKEKLQNFNDDSFIKKVIDFGHRFAFKWRFNN